MCRMAYVPNPELWEPEELLTQLTYLDKIGGGSGVGVGWIHKETNQPLMQKGVAFTPKDAYELMVEKADEAKHGFLYHSRIPSVGPKCDELCMPFNIQNSLFCYNGTWRDWRDAYYALLGRGQLPPPPSQVSDALIAAMLIEEIGPDYLELIDSGVVLYMTPDSVLLQKTYSGDFVVGRVGDSPLIYASALVAELDWDTPQSFKKVEPNINLLEDIPSSLLTVYHSYSTGWYSSKHAKNKKKNKKKGKAKSIAQLKRERDARMKTKKKPKTTVIDVKDKENSDSGYAEYIVSLCTKRGMALRPLEWDDINSCDCLPYAGVYLFKTDKNEYVGLIPMLATHGVLLGTPQDVLNGDLMFYIDEHDQTWVRRSEWELPVWVRANLPSECYQARDPDFDAAVAVIQNRCLDAGVSVQEITSSGSFFLQQPTHFLTHIKYSELWDKKEWAKFCLITEAEQIPDCDVVAILSTEDKEDDDDGQLWECEDCNYVTVGPAGLCLGCNSYKWRPHKKLLPPTVRDGDSLYQRAWKINQYQDPRVAGRRDTHDERNSLFSCSNCRRVLFGYQFDDVCPSCDVLLFNEFNLISPQDIRDRLIYCQKCLGIIDLEYYTGVCDKCASTNFKLHTSDNLTSLTKSQSSSDSDETTTALVVYTTSVNAG